VLDELAAATMEAERRGAKVQEAKERYLSRKRQKIG
jgi:hypothetical protein